MSLYISRTFRQGTGPDGAPGLPAGRVPVIDPVAAREIGAQLRLGEADTDGPPSGPTPGEIAALALLDDSYQRILDHHLGQRDATLMRRMLAVLRSQLGLELLDLLLIEFAEEYLGARMEGLSLLVDGGVGSSGALDRPQILRQVLVFWLLHNNPAAQPIVTRTHAAPILQIPAFREVIDLMIALLDREPGFEEEDASLWQLLIRPQILSPDSLSDQLSHLRSIWSHRLDDLAGRMDAFLGMLAEEQAPRFPPGPGPTQVPRYRSTEDEVRFSTDQSWMPSLVMVAKHTLVWLHQLSARYDRLIERLDQIPDAELERLSALGFDGLWLIGLWQRSPASEWIKRLCGNPEAAASAYSLTRYEVAAELGGEEALSDLRRRSAAHGIRLAADMVPNHTGLDSDWMVDRPDWFIGQDRSPFPAYSFEGQDLSSRPEIGIFLEDHYFDRSDAAVVFKRVDRGSGEERYIYHGNDGTSMPWNDTAQLDYLNPDVWPAVIDTIVAVAQRFPIIRFDAAMTLTRKHFQRLWYPAPGTAGDIPSRAEHGISTEVFLEAMPHEFWRQVVDRVAEEAPNTLLLAEAFWLMEGFFVRTLGMHRVYNSAFMNMLRDGETPKFRQLIKETLVFDPGILKRYVNFMSNPDELSAIEQFGDGDRYFGTCVLMATLPGLPMFSHGQVEGLRERYGMEYRRAYHEEWPREDLVQRHLQQIAPLLHRRQQFAEVDRFRLYDLVSADGDVHDHVIAFSNGAGDQTSLVVFNNSDHPAHGRLKVSTPYLPVSETPGQEPTTVDIGSALSMDHQGHWTALDSLSRVQFLFESQDVNDYGLGIDLGAWECRVLTEFQPVELTDDIAGQMRERLGWRGTPSLAALQRDLELEPLRRALAEAMNPALLQKLMELPGGYRGLSKSEDLLEELLSIAEDLARSVGLDPSRPASRLAALQTLPDLARSLTASEAAAHRLAGAGLQDSLDRRSEILPMLYGWVLLTILQEAAVASGSSEEGPDWQLESNVLSGLIEAGAEPEVAGRLVSVLQQAMRTGWGTAASPAPAALELQRQLLADEQLRRVLGANQFEGREYISREAVEALIDMRLLLEAQAWCGEETGASEISAGVTDWWQALDRLAADAEASAYRTDQLGIVEVADPSTSDE